MSDNNSRQVHSDNPSSISPPSASVFYQFLGVHSLLIGLFPFYIPVWLWRQDFSLASISLFVAISGLAFTVALTAWERLAKTRSAAFMYAISFALEVALVGFAAAGSSLELPAALFLAGLALFNGIYNCFFWTTQRALFLQRATPSSSGKQYGNLQIVVTIALKVGILTGGLLLEYKGMLAVLGMSACLSLLISLWFYRSEKQQLLEASVEHISLHEALKFRDRYGSRWVFLIDGLFLFLESHFWTLSLFILSREDFTRFGLTVIALAVGFAILFYLAKNTIDRLAGVQLFRWAVMLYAAGWIMRPLLGSDASVTTTAVLLIIVTFCTSFFRLVFNKRFFDIAAESSGQRYLLIKSYYTQFAVALIFSAVAVVLTLAGSTTSNKTNLAAHWHSDPSLPLNSLYILAGICSLIYLFYRSPMNSGDK